MAVGDVRQRAEPIFADFDGSQHREHAGRRLGRRRLKPADQRMSMRRADENRMGLAGQIEIVAVAAASGDEPQILPPPYRLTDAGLADAWAIRLLVHPPPLPLIDSPTLAGFARRAAGRP